MKAVSLFSIIILFFVGFQSNSQAIDEGKWETKVIKVFGNCEMCKERIENSLMVSGIKSAKWDAKTDELTVIYKPSKISIDKIHQLVAKDGHDTELEKASDEVYKELPGCCQYRKAGGKH